VRTSSRRRDLSHLNVAEADTVAAESCGGNVVYLASAESGFAERLLNSCRRRFVHLHPAARAPFADNPTITIVGEQYHCLREARSTINAR
jgi:hypothetical protein